MVNDIINGISSALYSNFKGVTIYSENVEQGLEEPCFFVMPLNNSETPLLGDRAFRNIAIDVHYFPFSKTTPNEEIQLVASKLYGVLRRIKLLNGDLLNGMKLRHEVENEVLHFFVEYKPTIRYVSEPEETQESFTHNVGVKNE